jgi:hypothetical protein
MFVAMEELLTWHERLDKLSVGDNILICDGEIVDVNVQSVYSAIRTHFSGENETKQFSIKKAKSGPAKGNRFVIRIK